ncbi:heme exporter protein CcmB [Kordiimonas marina]|uniref:heme exporter protein CcmB n=1 Tax=Kordiimonas marina TaxID=2872312 RepID=UPI001FF4644D|nr:heme exporter protein CcmB [Kordiimonas marina]MCJ9428114.1 heme exporter protein CcmB [Kordiimonas marina]
MSTPLSATFRAILMRDIRLAWSQGGTGTMALSFFMIAVTLFAFGVGPEPQVLARIAAGVIWVVALLACLLSLDRLYQADYEDGSLDDLALSPLGLTGVAAAKILAHWLATVVPLILIAPLLGMFMNLAPEGYGILLLSLLVGTPALSLIGSIGAALTVSVRRGGVLMALLVLPLYIPTLIFGVGAVDAAMGMVGSSANLALLGAVTLVALAIGPFASAAALRLALE